MKNNGKSVELCTPDGKVILILNFYEKEAEAKDNRENFEKGRKENLKTQAGNRNQENPQMTAAQKRYLFRILADKGLEGDKAHNHLKELFQVDSLSEVTKLEASKMIEYLLEEAKGGDDGPPF